MTGLLACVERAVQSGNPVLFPAPEKRQGHMEGGRVEAQRAKGSWHSNPYQPNILSAGYTEYGTHLFFFRLQLSSS